jgi:TniQ
MTTPARTLPVPLPPLHRELLGSYLHRLADANHLTIRGLSHEIGPGRHHRRDSDDTAGWTPAAVTRLAALAGTTPVALLHALPILQAVAPAGRATEPGPSLPPWHAHACLLCAARHGASGLAIIRVFPHERICARHGRWHGGGPQRPLRDLLPEIPHANALHRRLARRHGTAAVTGQYLQAQAQTRQWLAGDGPAELKSRWEHRLRLLGEDPYGDPHRPGADRTELVTYPEAVTMTRLAIMRSAVRTGSAAGYAAPDMLE